MQSYLATTILILIGLAGLSTLIHENTHMTREVQRLYWATCALVAGVTVAELGEVTLEQMGLAGSVPWLLSRWVDHVFTPAIGIALIRQIGVKNKWNRLLGATCAANAIWQTLILVSGTLAWVMRIPYDHLRSAPYAVYVAVYVTSLAVTLVQFLIYGSSFEKQNRTSLYLAITATICGLLMQELTDNQVRTTCLGLMTSLLMLFAHNESFYQNEQANTIKTQRRELMYDPLTCIFNRYAYKEATKRLKGQRLPDDFVVFSIDINGLKRTNDTYGHDAGDTLIQGAAACIRRTFKDAGDYYRLSSFTP